MSKPFRELPAWVTILIAVVTILCSAGATWATTGFRLTALETEVAEIKNDRKDRIRDYEQFKADIRVDIADIKGDIRVIRQAVERKQ